ncbi:MULTISPECIES: hypothetical protein [Spirosoma]|uniref:hypothetical protein n=1 Tax=Spirosoma TaxID=107 RepID=UPI000969CE93|nr:MULTISPECIES: hypothetical protein [Spirosoma]MBN8820707.1 hypothetical protein [Spirosoma sp.]OJW76382.1 MAG: hypothetical protein BGO59_22955 [Spirosoma sp. 48-14]
MTLLRVFQLFSFLVFSALFLESLYWLLNQPSDLLLIVAGLLIAIYIWISLKTRCFTKSPFKP